MFAQRCRPARFLGEDAMLRDFTINAIYYCPATGLFLDPTRRGIAAIAGRTLEFAGPGCLANLNPFLSLRVVKFMARGYRPTEEVKRFLGLHLGDDLEAMEAGQLPQWVARQVPPWLASGFKAILCEHLADSMAGPRVGAGFEAG